MHTQLSLSPIDLFVVGLYLVVLLYVGFRYTRRGVAAEDLFLSGRNLTWPKVGLSLFSTNVSPMMLIGFAGLAYSQGMVGANFEWLAWIFLMILAMVFVPHYQKNRISTMPGFLEVRFGRRSHRFLSYYAVLSIVVMWLGSTLYAGGLILAQALGLPLWLAAVVVAVVALSYTAVGGLAAVVRTDLLQSGLILFGSVVLTVMAFIQIGGMEPLRAQVPEDYWTMFRPADDPDYPWHAVIFGYAVVAIYFFCIDQTIVQKVLAAKNREEGQKGALFTAYLKVLMPLIFIVPGIFALVLYPEVQNTDEVYLLMVTGVLPVGMIGVMVAVMLAALINTIAAGLNSFSTVFTLDIYKKWVPDYTEDSLKRTGRIMTLAGALLALGLAVLFSMAERSLFEISQGLFNFFAPPLSVVFLVGVLWKRATPIAAEVTLLGGGALSVLTGIAYFADIPYAGFWPNFLTLSFYLFLILLVVMVTVSLLTRPVPEKALPSLAEARDEIRDASTRNIWRMWGVLALVMAVLYIVFN